MSAGGLTRPSLVVLSSVYHARTCHAGHSGRTGTPSSWVSSCQFINLRSGSVSAQVIAGKAGGGGRWFCAHANFLQSLSSKLPHPGRWLEAKEPSLSSPSQQISHRAEQPRTHMVGGLSSNRKEAVVVGRARAPAPEMRPCPGTSGESGQVISPLPPPETVPWRSHVRPCGGGEACVNLGKCFDAWVGTAYPLRVPNTGLQNRLVSEGHTLMSGHK